jgi:hypothetical protein
MEETTTRTATEKVHHYWWRFLSVYGEECYKTWRQELLASVIASGATFLITWANDTLAWSTLRTALGATAITLALFALWHLVKIPYLLTHTRNEPRKLAGYFGVLIVLCLMGGAGLIAVTVKEHWGPRASEHTQVSQPAAVADGKPSQGQSSSRQVAVIDEAGKEKQKTDPKSAAPKKPRQFPIRSSTVPVAPPQQLPPVVCKDNANCGVSTGQTGGITAGQIVNLEPVAWYEWNGSSHGRQGNVFTATGVPGLFCTSCCDRNWS